MNSQVIVADRLKTVRNARKIGRPKLAKKSGLTERKLAKLETGSEEMLPNTAVERLASALQVSTLTRTGEVALSADDLEPIAASTCKTGCCG